MWQAGIDMIRDKPVFGQGPRMVESDYPAYRWPGAPNPATPHLHNNALQIAAERGLPCLAWWLWWVAAAMGDALREARRARRLDAPVGLAGAARRGHGGRAVRVQFRRFRDPDVLLIVSALPYALRSGARRASARAGLGGRTGPRAAPS